MVPLAFIQPYGNPVSDFPVISNNGSYFGKSCQGLPVTVTYKLDIRKDFYILLVARQSVLSASAQNYPITTEYFLTATLVSVMVMWQELQKMAHKGFSRLDLSKLKQVSTLNVGGNNVYGWSPPLLFVRPFENQIIL